MSASLDPEPQAFHIVFHFKEKPFYYSAYVFALIPKYAIEVAHARLRVRAKMLGVENVKPYCASVSGGSYQQYFVSRSGEWLELEAWRALQAAKRKQKQRAASHSAVSQIPV